jgi:hypothetical protein
MKITRTYISGCNWCNATGNVSNPNIGIITDFTMITCPVCQGAKMIMITETFEDNRIVEEMILKTDETR